ncbi:MAG: hypothetical protein MRJ96_15955 [Nitrospirales bacterium]|nr:hypothetical protein [Nitrospira sp.]MDR4502939.1 hypothetical protein [Nitrospirales bacterium]
MCIPTTFTSSKLDGFKLSSDTLVKLHKTYKGSRGKVFCPVDGGRFVRVDDPRAVDSDDMRTLTADQAAMDLTQLPWLPRIHQDGTKTFGGKGAWIECQDVEIPKDKRLWFRYAFLRFDAFPTNAFAALVAYPKNNIHEPLPAYWISDVKDLEETHNGANQTQWTECFVEIDPNTDFVGTLRWVVGTGHNVEEDGIPNNTRFASPGCLLIDAIDVR